MASINALQALTIYVILLAADPERCRNMSAFVGIAMGVGSSNDGLCLKVLTVMILGNLFESIHRWQQLHP